MSRVDRPALKCDKCGRVTEDQTEMMRFCKLTHHHMSGAEDWDFCPECWATFRAGLAPKVKP